MPFWQRIYQKAMPFFWNLAASGLPADYDIDVLRKHIILNLLLILGVIFLGSLATLVFFQEELILSAIDIIILISFLWMFYNLRKYKNLAFASHVGIAIISLFFLFLVLHGGVNQTAFLWSFAYPLIALHLLGKKTGAKLVFIFLVFCTMIFALPTIYTLPHQYSSDTIIRFYAVYALIFLLGLIMEFAHEKVQSKLRYSKNELETAFTEIKKNNLELEKLNAQLIDEIQERRRVAKALKDNEHFLNSILESIQDGISVLNPDLTIRYTNSVMKQWYESNLPLEGQKCHVCYRNLDNPCNPCPSLECLKTGESERAIVPGVDGSAIEWLEVFSFPIKDSESDQPTGVVEFVRDITNHKRLEDQLARAQKMEAGGTLAGGVAHDLNNMLSGIVGYPEILIMDLPEDSPMRKMLTIMQTSGQKAAAIVQDMLTLTRRGISQTEVIDINSVVRDFISSPECKKILEYHSGVKVKTELGRELKAIEGSFVHLSKTLMNLISNAAEAMPAGGVIQVKTKNCKLEQTKIGYEHIPKGEYVVLTVSDEGQGIDEKDLNKIFDPFFTKKKMGRSGTGLGMTVVWGTVKDLNGFVDVNSVAGVGTVFEFYLPSTMKRLAEVEKAIAVHTLMGDEHIVIVDDVLEQREIGRSILKKLGYSVTALASGAEAITYFKNNRADLILLDMIMDPGIDGLETFKALNQIMPDQKVIMVSGYSENERVLEAMRIGAVELVKKPYSLEQIGIAVRKALDKKPPG